MSFANDIQLFSEQPISQQLLLDVLKDYKRPHDKIDELVKQGMLVQLKRGLYIPGAQLPIAGPEPFLIANHLYGPSYVSMETALSWWGLIPERVYEISSVTTNIAKTWSTQAGRFSYIHASLPWYSFGIKQVSLTKKQTVLMASPEKAVCDKIIHTSGILLRSTKQALQLLAQDLRIDQSALRKLDAAIISSWLADAPKKSSLLTLVKTLESL